MLACRRYAAKFLPMVSVGKKVSNTPFKGRCSRLERRFTGPTNSFLFVALQATQTLYSYRYNDTSRNFRALRLPAVCGCEARPKAGSARWVSVDQPPLIMSLKLRNSLATLALAFSSISL